MGQVPSRKHCEDMPGIFCPSEVNREMGDWYVIMYLYNVRCKGRTQLLTLNSQVLRSHRARVQQRGPRSDHAGHARTVANGRNEVTP